MRNKLFVRVGFLGLVAAIVLSLITGGASSAQEMRTYTVTIENLTSGQPFTPPVVVAHTDQLDVLEVGQAAPAEVAQIAENGNNDPLITLLGDSAGVMDHATGDAPIMPGESASLSVDAPAGSLLSAVFMLICTNDGFSGIDSLALPASGSQTVDTNAYDAGTEQNTEDFADIVPPCQALIGVMSDDEGTGMSNPALAEGGVIAAHPGIQGGTDLTVSDHGWTDPVARITVSVQEPAGATPTQPADATPTEPADVLPTSGVGPADDGGPALWPLYLGIGAAALLVLGGALRLARRPASR